MRSYSCWCLVHFLCYEDLRKEKWSSCNGLSIHWRCHPFLRWPVQNPGYFFWWGPILSLEKRLWKSTTLFMSAMFGMFDGLRRRQMWLIQDREVLLLNFDLVRCQCQFQGLRAVCTVPRHAWSLECSTLTLDFFLSWHHPFGKPGICSACS